MSQSILGRARSGVLRVLAAGAAVACLAAPAVASADNSDQSASVCVSQAARDALSRCPAGIAKPGSAKKPEAVLKAPPPTPPPRTNTTPPKNPDPTPGGGPRSGRGNMAIRQTQLLVAEIQQTETLFSQTPRASADRPGLIRRLAEDYVELSAASFKTRTERQIDLDNAKRTGRGDPKKLTEERDKADKVLVAARQNAIKYYAKLKDDHPTYCTSPNKADPAKSTGCVDEVLYYLAYEHEQAGELEKARKVYLELITKSPKSRFVASAYLAFGELYFNEAQGDPAKWALAAQAYSEVIKYPLPDNKMYSIAQYKLGYVYWNQSDFQRALSAFKRTIEVGQQYPAIPNAPELAKAARRDLVTVYSLTGQAKKAFAFFSPLAGATGADAQAALGMMDSLGLAYLDSGHYKDSIDLYQDLLERDKGPRQCLYQAHIVEATAADKSGSKDDIVAALDKQVEAYKKQQTRSPPGDLSRSCANATVELLAETAMAWHLEAAGSGGVRGTGDKKTMSLAAQLYDTTLQTFDKAHFAALEFPKIVKEDWPSRSKIAYLRADLLYTNQDWAKCGPAFDAVVADDPSGPDAAAAAYAAVQCYHRVYLSQHKDRSDRAGTGRLPGAAQESASAAKKLAPKELTPAQKEMLGAFDRYLCYIQQPDEKTKDREAYEQYVDIKFARARLYFEAQRWEEAGWAFRDIAVSYPKDDAALPAAQLYLESMNILASTIEPNRPACFESMAKDVPAFTESFCTGGKEKDNAADCAVLLRVQRGVETKVPVGIVQQADGMTGPEAMKLYEKGATAYMDLWKKYGEKACRDKTSDCQGNEVILYNAARAYQAARLLAKAISARKILIDPQFGLQKTDPARKAVYEIGANYQAIAVYDEAANYYERFAAESRDMPNAPEALQDAVVLRLGLGQEKQAMEDAQLFTKSYGAQKPALAARVSFAIGAHHAEKGDFEGARKKLSESIAGIDKHAAFDVQIQAHGMLGRAYANLHAAQNAQTEFGKVRTAWQDPEAAMKKLSEAYPDEAERSRALRKALTAVGEALFFFAEQKRGEVDKIKFPEYKGSGETLDVQRHVATKVADWVRKKRAAIDEADKEYRKIANLSPSPPPRWTVAAAARVGQMWSKFVAEFRAAPIPKEWKQNGPHPTIPDLTWQELRMRYYEELDRASEPQKQKAKAAYEGCLETSIKYQHFDEMSRMCEVWLSKNYGDQYHLVDEFRGAPSRVAGGIGERTLPVDMDGSFVKSDAADKAAPDKALAAATAKPQAGPAPSVEPAKPAGK